MQTWPPLQSLFAIIIAYTGELFPSLKHLIKVKMCYRQLFVHKKKKQLHLRSLLKNIPQTYEQHSPGANLQLVSVPGRMRVSVRTLHSKSALGK